MNKDLKRIIFTMGGKGGGGKTAFMNSLIDFLDIERCPRTLIDCDIENRVHGSLSHFFKDASKVDISTKRGFDDFVELSFSDAAPLIVADLGAGAGKWTFKWFDDMFVPVSEAGVHFLAVGVITNEVATAETVLNWATALKDRAYYLIVRNHRNGDDFSALEESESGKRFLKVSKAPLIDMEYRFEEIQRELDRRGLTLARSLDAPSEVAGPLLSKAITRMRMRGYLHRMNDQLRTVIETLLP